MLQYVNPASLANTVKMCRYYRNIAITPIYDKSRDTLSYDPWLTIASPSMETANAAYQLLYEDGWFVTKVDATVPNHFVILYPATASHFAAERHIFTSWNSVGKELSNASETGCVIAFISGLEEPKQQDSMLLQRSIDEINKRRIELIRKRDLSTSEQEELADLQIRMRRYMNTRYPLPFPALERLEEFAQKLNDGEERNDRI